MRAMLIARRHRHRPRCRGAAIAAPRPTVTPTTTRGSSSNTAPAFIIFGKSQAIEFATARAHRASWGYQRKTKRLPANAWPGCVDLPQYPTNFWPKCNIRGTSHPAIISMLMSVEECPIPNRGRGSDAALQSRWQISQRAVGGTHNEPARSRG